MKRIVIPTSEGRLIETWEGMIFPPPPPPKKREPPYRGPSGKANPIAPNGKPKRFVYGDPSREWSRHWTTFRREQSLQCSFVKRGVITGQRWGMYRRDAEAKMVEAKKQAEKDLENIKKNVTFEESASEEAMRAALEVLRSPAATGAKLQAARLILEWTKAKPASKSELTVNKAEEWLNSLESEDEGDS